MKVAGFRWNEIILAPAPTCSQSLLDWQVVTRCVSVFESSQAPGVQETFNILDGDPQSRVT